MREEEKLWKAEAMTLPVEQGFAIVRELTYVGDGSSAVQEPTGREIVLNNLVGALYSRFDLWISTMNSLSRRGLIDDEEYQFLFCIYSMLEATKRG